MDILSIFLAYFEYFLWISDCIFQANYVAFNPVSNNESQKEKKTANP